MYDDPVNSAEYQAAERYANEYDGPLEDNQDHSWRCDCGTCSMLNDPLLAGRLTHAQWIIDNYDGP